MKAIEKPTDKVTTDYLDIALRMVGISLDFTLIDKIIDLVELIEEKGGEASISDITKLKSHWLSTTTIEKFTGLKDRIGTRIFENDIIHYTEHNGYRLKSFDAVVVYDKKYAAFGYQKIAENGTYEEQPIHYFTEHDELEIDILPYIDVVGHIGEINTL